jgi:hypothetical protein
MKILIFAFLTVFALFGLAAIVQSVIDVFNKTKD